jgi:hypothetical protein
MRVMLPPTRVSEMMMNCALPSTMTASATPRTLLLRCSAQRHGCQSTSPSSPPTLGHSHRSRHLYQNLHSHRSILCRSSNSQDPEDDNKDNQELIDAFSNLRKWLGVDPSDGSDGMPINPGDSVMDLEDYFSSGGSGSNANSNRFSNFGRAIGGGPSPFNLSNLTGLGGPSSGGQSPPPSKGTTDTTNKPSTSSSFTDWSGGVKEDWDAWEGTPAVADLDDNSEAAELREQVIERRRARRGRRTKVRDEYLRPIVDVTGIYNRVAIGEKEAEERVFVEAITNQYESRESLQYAAILLGVPLTIGFIISHLIAQPLWDYAENLNPAAFALTDEQKVAGAEAMHREEVRLRLEASLGQAPPLTDAAMLVHLREEAVHFSDNMKAYNRQSLVNAVSDSCSGAALFVLLVQDTSQRAILFRTVGRVFTGLSDTAKAFLIILVTDILLGYHSEEGWTAGLHLLSYHYGWHAPQENLQIFVATVPVLLDSMFKYWIFVGLNKIDPAAAVTLKMMDRH